jgi:hypothetical protein
MMRLVQMADERDEDGEPCYNLEDLTELPSFAKACKSTAPLTSRSWIILKRKLSAEYDERMETQKEAVMMLMCILQKRCRHRANNQFRGRQANFDGIPASCHYLIG